MGRFMRAPDHDAASDGGSGDGASAGSDGADQGADGGADNAQGSDAGSSADGNAADDASLLEKAGSTGGDGDDGEAGDKDGKGDGDGKDDTNASDGPPETYELAPVKIAGEDGTEIEIEIDQALLTEATPIFKEAGLSNEQANKLAPLALKVQERVIAKQADDFAAIRADWAKEAKADKEIGGKNWAETETLAAKALDTFGAGKDSEFRKLLTESGFGDHPEMIRMFRKIGEKLGEDTATATATTGAQAKPDRVRELYPNDPPKEGAK